MMRIEHPIDSSRRAWRNTKRLEAFAAFCDAAAGDSRDSTADLKYELSKWAMEMTDHPERFDDEGNVKP